MLALQVHQAVEEWLRNIGRSRACKVDQVAGHHHHLPLHVLLLQAAHVLTAEPLRCSLQQVYWQRLLCFGRCDLEPCQRCQSTHSGVWLPFKRRSVVQHQRHPVLGLLNRPDYAQWLRGCNVAREPLSECVRFLFCSVFRGRCSIAPFSVVKSRKRALLACCVPLTTNMPKMKSMSLL